MGVRGVIERSSYLNSLGASPVVSLTSCFSLLLISTILNLIPMEKLYFVADAVEALPTPFD